MRIQQDPHQIFVRLIITFVRDPADLNANKQRPEKATCQRILKEEKGLKYAFHKKPKDLLCSLRFLVCFEAMLESLKIFFK